MYKKEAHLHFIVTPAIEYFRADYKSEKEREHDYHIERRITEILRDPDVHH